MNNFVYHIPTKVYFGENQLGHLGKELAKFGKRVLLTYGGGSIKRIGLYDRVMEELKKADMEVFELIVALDKGDVTVLPDLLTRLFTPAQKAALYEHCRKKSGKVPISAVASEFAEIILGLKDSEKK